MKDDHKRHVHEPDNLVTERDIDPNFGLFTEDSFPEALANEDQLDAVEHAIPKENVDGVEVSRKGSSQDE